MPAAGALVLLGLSAGAGIGVVARWWMRLITDDPEFSWSGTIFIVLAFAVAGLGHGAWWAVRRAGARRRWSTAARVTAVVLTLPIFTGAGAMMLPTVFGASLATARRDWPRPARAVAAVVALPVPIIIARGLVADGLSLRRSFGALLLAATYVAIVRSVSTAVAPVEDGWRMTRRVRIIVVLGPLALLLLVVVSTFGLRGG